MNIKKIATMIVVGAIALVVGAPMKAEAASDNKTRIKKLSKELKKLPNNSAPIAKVTQLVSKLSKLDPKKAAKYYKTGLKKLASNPEQQKQASKLAKVVTKIVNKSGLSESEIAKITKGVDKEENKVPPYQAYVTVSYEYALA
ncbi:MAG TPA: hypothetical protein VIM61_01970 [Chthoniobacterales bacterium]|jgi:hypothetical protein